MVTFDTYCNFSEITVKVLIQKEIERMGYKVQIHEIEIIYKKPSNIDEPIITARVVKLPEVEIK